MKAPLFCLKHAKFCVCKYMKVSSIIFIKKRLGVDRLTENTKVICINGIVMTYVVVLIYSIYM